MMVSREIRKEAADHGAIVGIVTGAALFYAELGCATLLRNYAFIAKHPHATSDLLGVAALGVGFAAYKVVSRRKLNKLIRKQESYEEHIHGGGNIFIG
jgi:hypothetical protein